MALPDLIMQECLKRGIDRCLLFGASLQAILEGALIPSPNPPEPYPESSQRAAEFAHRWEWLLETTASSLLGGTIFPNWSDWHRAIMIDRNAFAKWAAQRLERKAKSRPAAAKIERLVSAILADSKEEGQPALTQMKIVALVQDEYPDATRNQVIEAIRKVQPSKRGRPKKFATGN
jgi:hypothetical protein